METIFLGYKINIKKLVIVLIVGIMLIFAFLLALAPQYRGTNVTIEMIDRIFYLFFVLLIILSIAVSIEKTEDKIS